MTTSDSQSAETGLRSDISKFPAVPRHLAVSDNRMQMWIAFTLKENVFLGNQGKRITNLSQNKTLNSVTTKITNEL